MIIGKTTLSYLLALNICEINRADKGNGLGRSDILGFNPGKSTYLQGFG